MIPKNIYKRYDCVVLYDRFTIGRGGSPLQNLIIRGLKTTKITAFKCVAEIDAGLFTQKNIGLEGNAQDIFLRSTKIIERMIYHIIDINPRPVKQSGKVTNLKEITKVIGINLKHWKRFIIILGC